MVDDIRISDGDELRKKQILFRLEIGMNSEVSLWSAAGVSYDFICSVLFNTIVKLLFASFEKTRIIKPS